ncbi:hypothetical protein GBF38_008968 [Nibea albiflora]|uniref:Uncharacterized protein n=1 Tax=Nibea albiflora TaxID=240163 RepID=A0ACB7ERG4_NIBAL|nr:hypothetical protein GBF38_008968 [Nibea albiflora]
MVSLPFGVKEVMYYAAAAQWVMLCEEPVCGPDRVLLNVTAPVATKGLTARVRLGISNRLENPISRAKWPTLATTNEICVHSNYFSQAVFGCGTAVVSVPVEMEGDDC